MSKGVWGGWSHTGQFRRASPEPGGGERKNEYSIATENVWLLGCCDASDVIDGEYCIIRIMRGSGGNVNRLLPGVGVHVDERTAGTAGREKAVGTLPGKPGKGDVRLVAIEVVFD